MEYLLKNQYISVTDASATTYGGSQLLSGSKLISECGCGVVACCDLLLYMSRNCDDAGFELLDSSADGRIERSAYNALLSSFSRSYFPLIPHFGINGVSLALGLNTFFIKHKAPYRAAWGVSAGDLWDKIESMLSADFPVVLSVGPNFPLVWQKHKAVFYTLRPDGQFVPAYSAKAHYVSVTGMDGTWLRISSWGKELYLRRSDYESYVRKFSNSVVSNAAYIRHT